MTVWMRRALIVAAAAWLVYALAIWAPESASSDARIDAVASAPTLAAGKGALAAPSLIDGHDVTWWAARARQNGARMRALQGSLRDKVGIGARRLAGVHVQPDALVRAFLCIHRFEGSWTDPGKPYFGGVQMSLGFARTYGAEFYEAWGTPDRWPSFVQITVAMRAHLSGRGFHPWPNTARYCGLLP